MVNTTVRTFAVAAMTVATVVGLVRVFDDPWFLVPLLGVAVTAHLAAAATRRLPAGVAGTVMVLVGTLVCVGSTHRKATTGGLPTPSTFRTIGQDLSGVVEVLRDNAAPVSPEPGLLLIVAAAVWIAAWSADRLTLLYDAPAEAVVPTATVFVIVTALAGPDHRWFPVAVYGAAVAVHLLVQRHLAPRRDTTGVTGNLAWHPIASGLVVTALAITVGLGAAATVPALQFDGANPIRGDRTVEVTPPLIDLRDRLVNPTDEELFRTTGGGPHYWRLTAYDEFDGARWRMSTSRSSRIDGSLPTGPGISVGDSHDPATTTFELTGLDGTFAPAAFRPARLEGGPTRSPDRPTPRMRWDARNLALVVGTDDGGVGGLSYTVTSQIPQADPDRLAAVQGPIPAELDRYTDLPEHARTRLGPVARQITADASGPYAHAMALQRYFQEGFVYQTDLRDVYDDPDGLLGESTGAITAFLQTRVGYCVHFAGAYAALARTLGLPARVAVGFTPGSTVGDGSDTRIVRSRNAHVWPEVFFDGYGWLPFEPSPGRGNHDAESYTGTVGVDDPDFGSGGEDTQPVPSTTAPDGAGSTPAAPTTATAPRADVEDDASRMPTTPVPTGGARSGRALSWTGLLLAGAVMVGPSIRLIRRGRRRRSATDPARRVRLAWTDTLDAWTHLDLHRRPSDTDRDLGERLAGRVTGLTGESDPPPDPRRLAELATAAAWNAPGVTDRDVVEARREASGLERMARRHRSAVSRLVGWFDPRYRGGD